MAVMALVLGCEARQTPPQLTTEKHSFWYADGTKQDRFKQELKEAGVSYKLVRKDGRELVEIHEADFAKVDAIRKELFGPELPSGRNLGMDAEHQAEFTAWLRERHIPFEEMKSDGRVYVVWEEADAAKVREWEHFPKWYDNPPLPRD